MVLSDADKARVQNIINEGVQVFSDIKNLREGLKETVASISEDLEIKPATLNKAIRMAFKLSENSESLDEDKKEMDSVEELLMAAGKV